MDDNKYKGRLIIRTEVYYTTISPCIFLLSKSVAGGGGSTSAWYVWATYFIVTGENERKNDKKSASYLIDSLTQQCYLVFPAYSHFFRFCWEKNYYSVNSGSTTSLN